MPNPCRSLLSGATYTSLEIFPLVTRPEISPVVENRGRSPPPPPPPPIILASFHFEKCNMRDTCYTWPIRTSKITRLGALAWVLLLETSNIYTLSSILISNITRLHFIANHRGILFILIQTMKQTTLLSPV
jgi:hypothetical protein